MTTDDPYRAPASVQTDRYRIAWFDLGRRRRVAAIAIVLFAAALPAVFTEDVPLAWRALAVSIVVVAGIGPIMRLSAFRCPRCKKLFTRWGIVQNLFTRRCLHCGVAMGKVATALATPPELGAAGETDRFRDLHNRIADSLGVSRGPTEDGEMESSASGAADASRRH